MLADFGYVGILLLVAVLYPVGAIATSFILGLFKIRPHNPDPIKSMPYECGMDPVGDAWVQFNFRYYIYALLFVVFDIETVFLYPWAVYFRQLGLFGLIEVTIFLAILVVGYVYAWQKRTLEWR